MSTAFQITIDCDDAERMATFWCQALGYVPMPPPEGFESWSDFATATQIEPPPTGSIRTIVDPDGERPSIKFLRTMVPSNQRPGFNLELLPGDAIAKQSLIEELKTAGARELGRRTGTDGWWAVMSDPEGNEFCVI